MPLVPCGNLHLIITKSSQSLRPSFARSYSWCSLPRYRPSVLDIYLAICDIACQGLGKCPPRPQSCNLDGSSHEPPYCHLTYTLENPLVCLPSPQAIVTSAFEVGQGRPDQTASEQVVAQGHCPQREGSKKPGTVGWRWQRHCSRVASRSLLVFVCKVRSAVFPSLLTYTTVAQTCSSPMVRNSPGRTLTSLTIVSWCPHAFPRAGSAGSQ